MVTERIESAGSPWWASLQTLGSGLADRLSESATALAQAKIDKEIARHGPTRVQTSLDASASQDVNAANAPVKGQDSDGSTITANRVINVGPLSVKSNTLKMVGYASGALLIGAVSYKILAK